MGREIISIRNEGAGYSYSLQIAHCPDFEKLATSIRDSLTSRRESSNPSLYNIHYEPEGDVGLDEQQRTQIEHIVRRHNERALALLILHGNASPELVDPVVTGLDAP